jgi:hypothetical protein
MTLELVPLATGRVKVRPSVWLPNTPQGARGIYEITSFDVEGDRLRAHLFGVAAADWPVVSPDGTITTLDIRVTIETHDGALLYGAYGGRMDLTKSPLTLYSAPRFDTGDERYLWLSRIQVVGKGILDEDQSGFDYELFELR